MNARAQAAAAYRAQSNDTLRLVQANMEVVSRIAHHLAARLPASVEVDDLIQAGSIGLLEAARTFQDGLGATFETYASIRIRGAMIDEMRKTDWVPRSVHRNYRAVAEATRKAEQALGRAATAAEIAEHGGMTVDEYQKATEDAFRGYVISLDSRTEDADGDDHASIAVHIPDTPAVEYSRSAFSQALAKAIESLPERERLILSLYYEEELSLKEIGLVIGVSESRVSQLLGQAKLRIGGRMRGWETKDALTENQDLL